MTKPKITQAAVEAAHDVLDNSIVPVDYFTSSSDRQRQMRMDTVRKALIAAAMADQP